MCFSCKGGHASDACPNRCRWERPAPDDDDFRSVASDVDAVSVQGMTLLRIQKQMFPLLFPLFRLLMVLLLAPLLTVWLPSTFWLLAPPQAPAASQTSTPVVDEQFNQLDKLRSQDESPSQSVLSGVVNEACEFVIGMLGVTDSPVSGSSSSVNSGVQPQDCDMSEASLAWKRDVSEYLSSDDSRDRSRSRGRKSSHVPGVHVPSGVSAAVELARCRSSSSLRSVSSARRSSKS